MASPWEQFQEPQAPLAPAPAMVAPASASPWQQFERKPSYNYTPPDDGGDETLMFEGGTEVKAPAGTGRVFAEIENDDAFDPPPSTALEETAATFEKQAAYIALVANAYGLVPDDGIADFVASRSKALAHAQKNQPEYMKGFQSQFENAKGFFETAGVMLSNPRAIGRTVITQSPNSALPLITTAIGAVGGAAGGSAVPVVGTVVGGAAGGTAGAFAGSALVEVGSTIDQLMIESGVDVTDATQVLAALQNQKLMDDIKLKAEKKGLTTAAVDAMFQVVGGRFLRSMAAGTVSQKAGALAADTAVQSVGEFTGEAAGQQVAFGKVDYKDAAMEAVSAIAQSAGQSVIGGVIPSDGKPPTAPKAEATRAPQKETKATPEQVVAAEKQAAVATQKAQAEVAADVILQSPAISEEVKANVRALGTDFTVEQLHQAAAGRSNKAIAPITEQEMAKQKELATSIQAESDDIAVNLLREVTAIQESKAVVDTDTQALLEQTADVLKQKRAIKKPVPLSTFVRSLGGVQEYQGELKNLGITKRSRLLSDKGMLLDDMGKAAFEAGYFSERPSVEEFIAALGEDFNGRSVFTTEDLSNSASLGELDALMQQLDGALNDKGITYSREKLQELRARVKANMKLDKAAARETKARDMQMLKLAADKRAIESKPAKILADKLKTYLQGMRKGGVIQRSETADVQNNIISMIEKSGLEADDRAKFVRTVKNVQTVEQMEAALPDIIDRVERLLDVAVRRDTVAKIKKLVANAKKSQSIAADLADRIEETVSGIELKNRSAAKQAKLEKTLAYFKANPDERAPASVMKELARLDKKQIGDISTKELTDLLTELRRIEALGRTKQDLKERAKERRQETRLNELKGSVVPIVSRPLAKAGIGERLTLFDEVKNKFTSAANKARSVSLALNPMDVFFDMMDNNADYKGAAHTVFKKTIDASFSRYLNTKESITRDVKNLADKYEFDSRNFERIGVYAAAQQEGGMKKLEATGVSEAEVKALLLTPQEMEFYTLMREKLDAMFPAINKVMIDVYNKNVEQVGDYFPFMTDFDAMNDTPIQDMLGSDAPTLGKKKDVERGFTQKRKGGAQVIRLDAMNVFLRHVDNATYLVEMSQDIKELGELAQTKEFGQAAGDMAQEFVTEWIDLLARKGNAPNRVEALDTLRRNVGAAVLGYKLSSILIQPTALADGAALVGGNYVARGVNQVASSAEWRAFLKANFPEIRERVGDDPAYLDMGGKSKLAHVRDAGFWALKNVDLLCASSVAAGAYIRSVEERGGSVDLSVPDAQAITDAQMYLRRTQSSGFAKDAPMIISSGKLTGNASLDKLIFQFQSFMLNRWSVIQHDIVKVGIVRGKTQQAVNGATFLLLAMMMEVGVRRLSKEAVNALIGGDDLDPWEDTIEEEAVRTAVGTMPIVGGLVGSLEYGSVPVPAISLIDEIFEKMQYAAQSKSTDKKVKHYSSAAIIAAGAAFGISGTLQAEQLSRKLQDDEKNKTKKGF